MSEKLRTGLYLLVALAVLAGLWQLLRPAPMMVQGGAATGGGSAFTWGVANGVASGPELLVLRQGERVRLQVTSDEADELHLHGYEITRQLMAGRTESVTFTADRSGRFDLELHRRHRTLAVLEVTP